MTDRSENFLLLNNGTYVNVRHVVSAELTENCNYYSIYVCDGSEMVRVGLVPFETWDSIWQWTEVNLIKSQLECETAKNLEKNEEA